jgi:hypothetical protein
MTASSFGERFAVATFADGGIVVDLVTGAYFRLNASAAIICEALVAADDVQSAGVMVAKRLRIDDGEAARAVEEIRVALGTPSPRRDRPDPFRYGPAPEGDGYVLSSNGSPKLWMSADGLVIRALSVQRESTAQTFEYLRAAAPKLLFLQGAVVLHGAACTSGHGLLVFSGDSGAGKTTTAKAFSAAGATLFAEDMLVVGSPSPLAIHAGGEQAIRKWAADAAELFHRTTPLDASGLSAVIEGAVTPVAEIWFIAAEHRAEGADRILPRRLGATDGALAVMSGLFLGATTPAEWRRFLGLASTIATSTPLFEARMPRGLDALRRAAELYTQNSAS